MPRNMASPMKDRPVLSEPSEVTAVICVFIPGFSGYYLERLRILQTCLMSLRANAGMPLDVMVIDNGSHPRVKRFLEDQVARGAVQHLISNEQNLGKGRALNMAFRAVQSEYIAYSDDDILFFPNWLVDEMRVHKAFPNVGIVGGQVVPDSIGFESGKQAASQHGFRTESYRLEPDRLAAWAKSIGYEPEEYAKRDVVRERLGKLLLLENNGVQAVTGCAFYQGLLRRDLVDKVPPIRTGVGVGSEDVQWRQMMEEQGWLLLNTPRRVTHHLGNRIASDDRHLVQSCGFKVHGAPVWRKALDPKEWELQLRRAPGFEMVKPVARAILRRN